MPYKYKIQKKNILGHSDIAPQRKKDPGEKFPWKLLAKNNISFWHSLSENFLRQNRRIKVNDKDKKIFFKNLHKIGYRYFSLTKILRTDKSVIKAFQRRFLQNNVNGEIDQKTFNLSHFLSVNDKN